MNAIKEHLKFAWRAIGLALGSVLPQSVGEMGGYITLAVIVGLLLVGWASSVYVAYQYGAGISRAREIAVEGTLDGQIAQVREEAAAQVETVSRYNYYRALFDWCMFSVGDVAKCNADVKDLAAEYDDQLYGAPSPDFDWRP